MCSVNNVREKGEVVYNELIENFEIEEINFKNNVKVKLVASSKESNINIKVDFISVDSELECVRCLAKFTYDVSGSFEVDFVSENEYKDYLGSDLAESSYNFKEVTKEPIIGDEIDILEILREYIALEIPNYPICSDNCKGLKELNTYENDNIDSRWNQLLEITSLSNK